MLYPTLKSHNLKQENIDLFGGYNHNYRISSSEFYDMRNMTSSFFPVLSPRGNRGLYAAPGDCQGLIAKDSLCYVDGSEIVVNQHRVDLGLSLDPSDCPKKLVSMGAYIIIMPDKKYINTADLSDFGDIEVSVSTGTNPVSFTLCTLDGAAYEVKYSQATEPAEPENSDLWIDTSSMPHSLKQWSETNGMWVTIATTYVKISCPGIGASFQRYDGVTISGLKDQDLIDSASSNVIVDDNISAIDGSFVLWACGTDYIVVAGLIDATRSLSNNVTVSRTMPNMDFVIESENRLWGCRYGVAANGAIVNEIYASKLGDFRNWNCFMGISTDSYVASVGTDGQFTGAIAHLGYPLFFKETCVHKIYGNFPSNYQIQTTSLRGVQKGCSESLAIVNEVLYYKSQNSICLYDGSLPAEISAQLGEERYSNAVGGAHGNKYYVSMQGEDKKYHLFVYDAKRSMWHKEDNTHASAFCSCRGELYYIDAGDGGKIKTMFGSGTKDTLPVDWMVETGVIGTDMPEKKYISRLMVRMSLALGTRVYFYAQYDSMGAWEHLFTMTGNNLRSFSVPVRPRRCDHLRLRIVGEGDAKIYSITKLIKQGSDS